MVSSYWLWLSLLSIGLVVASPPHVYDSDDSFQRKNRIESPVDLGTHPLNTTVFNTYVIVNGGGEVRMEFNASFQPPHPDFVMSCAWGPCESVTDSADDPDFLSFNLTWTAGVSSLGGAAATVLLDFGEQTSGTRTVQWLAQTSSPSPTDSPTESPTTAAPTTAAPTTVPSSSPTTAPTATPATPTTTPTTPTTTPTTRVVSPTPVDFNDALRKDPKFRSFVRITAVLHTNPPPHNATFIVALALSEVVPAISLSNVLPLSAEDYRPLPGAMQTFVSVVLDQADAWNLAMSFHETVESHNFSTSPYKLSSLAELIDKSEGVRYPPFNVTLTDCGQGNDTKLEPPPCIAPPVIRQSTKKSVGLPVLFVSLTISFLLLILVFVLFGVFWNRRERQLLAEKKKEALVSDPKARRLHAMGLFQHPLNTPFKQQQTTTWRPVFTPWWVTCTFMSIGIVFIPAGFVFYTYSESVVELTQRYDNLPGCEVGQVCAVDLTIPKDMVPPIFLYYGVTNFFQNHRSYIKSLSMKQLRGGKNPNHVTCAPLETYDGDLASERGKILYPCGRIAHSFFSDQFLNPVLLAADEADVASYQVEQGFQGDLAFSWSEDTATLSGSVTCMLDNAGCFTNETAFATTSAVTAYLPSQPGAYNVSGQIVEVRLDGSLVVRNAAPGLSSVSIDITFDRLGSQWSPLANTNWQKKGIAWPTDLSERFKPYPASHPQSAKYTRWNNRVEGSTQMPPVDDEELVVWMRVAPEADFTKLHRRILDRELHKGDILRVWINNQFDIESLDGTKSIVLSTNNFLGGGSNFMGVLYLVVGAISLFLGFFVCFKHDHDTVEQQLYHK